MANSGKEGPREQHNHGPGPLIGRDNYGDIRYEMLDPKTKTALAKLSKDAPGLAKLLTQALHDGIISPDAVAALESAVRNINEDVAEALMIAGKNINEDVAESLWFAGKNINKDVADNILRGAETLSEATNRLDYVSSSLNKTVEKVNGGSGLGHLARLEGTLTGAAERIERVFTPPPPEIIVDQMGKFKMFLLGVVVGVLAVVLLIRYHVKPF